MFCALIMAGGKGTRFWPQSTEEKPKQFLKLVGTKTMLQMTCSRVEKIIPIEKIFVVTSSKYIDLVKNQLPQLPKKNIIIEPEGRNTAPCILLSALYIKQIYKNANIAVLPSDHTIGNEKKFVKTLEKANEFVKENKDAIVTIGIEPTRPETEYGYIKYLEDSEDSKNAIKVEQFVEKPTIKKAKQYLESGNYLWNAGMFIFNVDAMISELQKNYKVGYENLAKLSKINTEEYRKKLQTSYKKCEPISIDYAVMEKSKNIYVIPANFGWDDVGTWNSLERYIKKDENENIAKGNVEFSNAKNCIVYGEQKRIVLIDVENLFVTEGEDTIIVTNKNNMDKIKEFKK